MCLYEQKFILNFQDAKLTNNIITDKKCQRFSEIIAVEPQVRVEGTLQLRAEVRYEELPGPAQNCREQVSCLCAVVFAAESDVQVQVDFSVEGGDVACEPGYFHLSGEGPVHVLFCLRVEEPQDGLVDGAYSRYLS